ncbi:hypothetical protein C2G38_2029325 [Gigaspora rosea]|uniref:Uncharacterized protein n=1 Tax=Gigaspora rosea TaxID=44941 RepID=A0A397W2G8_9GLOM|nr:hypothetical protein C2G38_2029325 [Gigaspora rosea]
MGHSARYCMSGKTKQIKTGEVYSRPKDVNFCELVYNNEKNNLEVYNVGNDSTPKATKRPVNPKWNTRLRERKVTKVQGQETSKTRQENDLNKVSIQKEYKNKIKQKGNVDHRSWTPFRLQCSRRYPFVAY